MKVLWITNTPFPDPSIEPNSKQLIKGWVYSAASGLLDLNEEIILAVATFYSGKEIKQLNTNNIAYYLIPNKVKTNSTNSKYDWVWQKIKKMFNPDLVHIHGSEYPYSYSYVRACGGENVILSIQGLVSVIEKYYFGGITRLELFKSTTIRDLVKSDTIFRQHRKMCKRGKHEKLLIQNIHHIIGRTTWDRDHTWAINPNANYHFCNETLRSAFYNKNWDINNCERNSIFVSQAYYPLKGFHQLLNALPIVLKYFPYTKVYVAGNNFFTNRGIKINGYGNYINSIINKFKLNNQIQFTGILDEETMCQTYLNSHLFVSPSAIENSSNSIGEAQILGVPCIASYVGGTPDLINHGETGLMYRFEEVEMLAANICKIFDDNKLSKKISDKAKAVAIKRHNRIANAIEMYKIYSKVLNVL
jgi:glycosyltransferase involved in cell wall biosynthesis